MMRAMSVAQTISTLIHLPRHFSSLGNVSFYSLLKESGYFAVHDQVSESAIREAIVRHPECVEEWIRFSEDKRTNSGWFFHRDAAGCYAVGYFRVGVGVVQRIEYTEATEACAAFIKREVEDVRGSNPK